MLAVNHIALATATVLGASLWLEQPFWPPLILFVVVGSLLPDIDHSGSQLGKLVPWTSILLKHRGATHSLVAGILSTKFWAGRVKLMDIYKFLIGTQLLWKI